jgi:hypothetical protein
MSVKNLQKVIEPLAVTDKATIVVDKAPEGKIRVTSGSWDGEKVILKGQVLEVRSLHVARKKRHRDDWDPRSSPMPCMILEQCRRNCRSVID